MNAIAGMKRFAERCRGMVKRGPNLLAQKERELSILGYEAESTRRENLELRERIPAITERLARVTAQRPPDRTRMIRICLDLDPYVIESGFLHGNDSCVIEYVGRHIGVMAAREIRRANFQRWEV